MLTQVVAWNGTSWTEVADLTARKTYWWSGTSTGSASTLLYVAGGYINKLYVTKHRRMDSSCNKQNNNGKLI